MWRRSATQCAWRMPSNALPSDLNAISASSQHVLHVALVRLFYNSVKPDYEIYTLEPEKLSYLKARGWAILLGAHSQC
jgi:hypothetical protein